MMEELQKFLEEKIAYYQDLLDMGEGAHNSSDVYEFEGQLSAYKSVLYKLKNLEETKNKDL